MDLVSISGMIYVIGLVIIPILIRVLPVLNRNLHKHINTPNPAVFSTVVWPIVFTYIAIYYTYVLFVSTINWVSGNGFIHKSNETYSLSIFG